MKETPEKTQRENDAPEEKTMMIDTSQWSKETSSSGVRRLHGIAPEVVARRPWKLRLKDLLHRLLRHFLELIDMERILRFQNIDQIMTDPLHLLRTDLSRSNVKSFVDLHRIRADDLPADRLCE